MIIGTLAENLDMVVTVEVADSSGVFQLLEVVIDTGFNGDLALPRDVIAGLGLAYRGHSPYTLGTGEAETLRNYEGLASWRERTLDVEITETESESLVGMAMLTGSKISIPAQIGGEVSVEEAG